MLILVAIVSIFLIGWLLLRWHAQMRLARLSQATPDAAVLRALDATPVRQSGEPALLYFTTQDCAQCGFQQTPVLQRLAEITRIPIITVDAIERTELARHFGIMTVPSTVLLDAHLAPVAINHGVAHLDKLRAQISALPASQP